MAIQIQMIIAENKSQILQAAYNRETDHWYNYKMQNGSRQSPLEREKAKQRG